jgi:hypothetical protein
MKKEDVKKLFQDESFLAELNKVDSMESLREFLLLKGIKMSMDDIDTAIRSGAQVELDEDDLKDISGGMVLNWVKIAWDCFMFTPMDVYKKIRI